MSNLPATIEPSGEETSQFITFKVGEELFGVSILCVDEIITPKPVTAIPRTPDYFKGIINLRGDVISIISLRERFHLDLAVQTEEEAFFNRIVVIQAGGMKLGLLVDSINSILTLNEKNIQGSTKLISQDKQGYIRGSYKLNDASLLLMLDQEKLVNETDFQMIGDMIPALNDATEVQAAKEQEIRIRELFLVGFSIGEERFSIESAQVEEIVFLPETTPVPEMDSFVEGIFDLRGEMIPLIRLADKLDVQGNRANEDSPVIIAKVFGVKVGFLVDQITEVYIIKENEILDPPINLNPAQQDQLKGVVKKQIGEVEHIIMLLILNKMFDEEEQKLLKDLDAQNEKIEEEVEDLEEEIPMLEFELKGEKYSVPVLEASEIIPIRETVPVPKAPKYIEGVINLRGDVISIVHLPKLVGNHEFKSDPMMTKILIVETQKGKAGLIIEKVLSIKKHKLSSFEQPNSLVRHKNNIFIRGMKKDDNSEDILVLIDLEKTLYQAQNPETESKEVTGLLGLQAELEHLGEEEQLLLLNEK